jgi:hypothetical protein
MQIFSLLTLRIKYMVVVVVVVVIIIIISIEWALLASLHKYIKSRDSSVGIALGHGLDDWGSKVRFPAGAGNFSLHHRVQNGSAPSQPAIQLVLRAISLGVKRPGRKADNSHPSNAEVKNAWSYTSTPPMSSWCGP